MPIWFDDIQNSVRIAHRNRGLFSAFLKFLSHFQSNSREINVLKQSPVPGMLVIQEELSPQASARTRSQFSPIIFRIFGSSQPARSIAAVMFGKSPMVRMPSGFTISPSLRPWALTRLIQSRKSWPRVSHCQSSTRSSWWFY